MHGGEDRDLFGHRAQRCGKRKGLVAQRADIELAAKSLPARDRQDELEAGAVDHLRDLGNLSPVRPPPLRHFGNGDAAVGVEREQAELELVGVVKRVGVGHAADLWGREGTGIVLREFGGCKWRSWPELSQVPLLIDFAWAPQPTPFGLRRGSLRSEVACLAVARGASEGWWGKKDSNLRSHKTADLQSAPFATRDTPPSNSIVNLTAKRRRIRPWMTLSPGADGELPVGRVYGRRGVAKSTKAGHQKGSRNWPNCHNPEPVTEAFP